jgi:hypothetical protein
MEENQMKILADALWGYFSEKYLKPFLSDSVCYFVATVTTAPAGGVIGIQRPFDNAVSLPYAWSASTLSVGDTCLVLMLGDMTNAIVIGKGDLSEPGIYVTKAGLLQGTGTATDNTMSQDAITDALSALQPTISGAAGQYVGFDANGNALAISPDAAPTNGSTKLVTSDGVYDALALKAPLASPALTGTPTAPTAAEGTNTTQIATTAFVNTAIKKYTFTFTTSSGWITYMGESILMITEATHGCGANPAVDVYVLSGSEYIKSNGYPSDGWRISVASSGDISIIAAAPFAGKLVIR